MFGYQRLALLGINVKALIPEIIGKHHNNALIEVEKKMLAI